MEFFSHSKLSTFEQCKLRYKFRYIDKIKPEIEKSIEAHLGTTVHSTFEWLYSKVKEGSIPTLDEVIIRYSQDWMKNYKPEIVVVKKNMTVKDYYNKGIQFLINYYTKHEPFSDNTLEVEKEILLNLDEEGRYKIRGFIDRLVYNLETEEYEIHDYKTANSIPHKEKIDNDRQLALYSIAIKEIFGQDKEVKLIWHYLSFNKIIYSRRTNDQLKKLKEETLELIEKIKSTVDFTPNKSVLCNWCEYKSICPVWENSPEKGFPSGKKFDRQKRIFDFI